MTLRIGVIPHHNMDDMEYCLSLCNNCVRGGVSAELFSLCLMVCLEMVCGWIECDTGREKGS